MSSIQVGADTTPVELSPYLQGCLMAVEKIVHDYDADLGSDGLRLIQRVSQLDDIYERRL